MQVERRIYAFIISFEQISATLPLNLLYKKVATATKIE
jgi:hypothetical protein